jgi:hypothetical protein
MLPTSFSIADHNANVAATNGLMSPSTSSATTPTGQPADAPSRHGSRVSSSWPNAQPTLADRVDEQPARLPYWPASSGAP